MQEESLGRGELSRPHGSTCKGPEQRECGVSRTQSQCDGNQAAGVNKSQNKRTGRSSASGMTCRLQEMGRARELPARREGPPCRSRGF